MKHALSRSATREWIEGEITQIKRPQSGHVYFVLKDVAEGAVLDGVMYSTHARGAWRYLVEGARVHVQGKPDLYIPRGRLQLMVDRMRPAGRGSQLEALERLKQKLAAEGLFAQERKRALPSSPRVIGVVTSEHGAAIHDIVSTAFRRGGAHLVLAPAQVQGEQAVRSILAAIDLIERHPQLDVLIVGRGGGSAEDLIAFNDERLVRRLAQARVPVVSAVGHEIDTTLTDLVADVRAATPSQAAELVVQDRASQLRQLEATERYLGQAIRHRLNDDRNVWTSLQRRLGDPLALLGRRGQELDELQARFTASAARSAQQRREQLNRLDRRLVMRDPKSVLARTQAQLAPLELRLTARMQSRLRAHQRQQEQLSSCLRGQMGQGLERRQTLLRAAVTRLDDLSPLRILNRGFAIASHSGRILRSSSDVSPGAELDVRLACGAVKARVLELVPEAGGGGALSVSSTAAASATAITPAERGE